MLHNYGESVTRTRRKDKYAALNLKTYAYCGSSAGSVYVNARVSVEYASGGERRSNVLPGPDLAMFQGSYHN